MTFTLDPASTLSSDDAAAVRSLAARTAERDGAPPLSDDALLRLGEPTREHLLLRRRGEPSAIEGYAQLAREPSGNVAEVLGDAQAVEQLLAEVERHGLPVTVWSHGQASPVASVATARGYRSVRTLWQLRRALSPGEFRDSVASSAPSTLEGITIRPLSDDVEEQQRMLAVNAAAFATHPEQGSWTMHDVHARMQQPWFDPNGLLVAVNDANDVLGFHWTKVHPDRIGEVYVLAVSPDAQGRKLGSALLLAGLRHLALQNTSSVSLYVDDDNTAAMELYERYGFTRFERDTQLRKVATA